MNCSQCGTQFEGKFCPNCGAPAVEEGSNSSEQVVMNQTNSNVNKPFYKKWWFWVIIAVVVISIISGLGGDGEASTNSDGVSSIAQSADETSNDTNKNETANKAGNKITVVDFTTMSKADIESWAATNKVTVTFSEDYSDKVASGSVISQNKKANGTVKEGVTIKVVLSKGKKPSMEYQNALKKAESYSKLMHMSKQRIYDQLTSEYGEKFPADAAQYAVDNLKADYKANALEKAKSYQQTMNMSKSAIYDQLVSKYGEQFTAKEAQYAIDHLDD